MVKRAVTRERSGNLVQILAKTAPKKLSQPALVDADRGGLGIAMAAFAVAGFSP
jgi:hypothetical protein